MNIIGCIVYFQNSRTRIIFVNKIELLIEVERCNRQPNIVNVQMFQTESLLNIFTINLIMTGNIESKSL